MLANGSESDLDDLYADENLVTEMFEVGDTACKGLARDHRMALRLIEPQSVRGLAWDRVERECRACVGRHAAGWSDLRVRAVTELLLARLGLLRKRFGV